MNALLMTQRIRRKNVERIADYSGVLLNHLEAVYRPGDRELAKEFFGVLGLVVKEFSFTSNSPSQMFAVHPEEADQDITNNIIFLHQMSPAHAEFDALVRERCQSDPALAEAHARFRETMQAAPGGTPHFGLRFRSMKALDAVTERLRTQVSNALRDRVTVSALPPYPARPGVPNIRQVFVYTDVVTTSPAGYGQLIELQVERV